MHDELSWTKWRSYACVGALHATNQYCKRENLFGHLDLVPDHDHPDGSFTPWTDSASSCSVFASGSEWAIGSIMKGLLKFCVLRFNIKLTP